MGILRQRGAPRDYVQARPGTGVDDTGPEPESDLDRRAESDSSSGSDSENFTLDAKSHPGEFNKYMYLLYRMIGPRMCTLFVPD